MQKKTALKEKQNLYPAVLTLIWCDYMQKHGMMAIKQYWQKAFTLVLTPTTLITDSNKGTENAYLHKYTRAGDKWWFNRRNTKCIETDNSYILQQIMPLMQCLQEFIYNSKIIKMHLQAETMHLILRSITGII